MNVNDDKSFDDARNKRMIAVSKELVAKIKPGGYILLQKSLGFDGWTIQCREKHLAEPFVQAYAPTLEEAIGKLISN